jgi:HemX protein
VVFLPVVLLLHLVKLVLQGKLGSHCPTVGIHEAFSFIAFALGVIYFVTERYQKYFATGALFIGIILIFQSISLFVTRSIVPLTQALETIPYGWHAALALLALAAIATSAIYSLIYLSMFYLLKHKRFSGSLKQIPPLETIERMQTLSATIGFALISVAILVGSIIGFVYKQNIQMLDAKILASIGVLIIFAYGVIGSWFFNFSGRKKSMIIIIGFIAAIFSMTIVRLYMPTFHRF